jgi:hypothetical protein
VSTRDKEFSRECKLDKIETSTPIRGVKMEAIPEAVGYGFLDDAWDDDGDSIVVHAEYLFHTDGEGMVQTVFAQGSGPLYVARVLRKFADMLEGPEGPRLANMASDPGNVDYARRKEDGEVLLSNIREVRARGN